MLNGQTVHGVRANFVDQISTLEGALARLEETGRMGEKNFLVLEWVIETHLRDDLVAYQHFLMRKFRSLALFVETKVTERLRGLQKMIEQPGMTMEKLLKETATIKLYEHVARLAHAFEGEEPATN